MDKVTYAAAVQWIAERRCDERGDAMYLMYDPTVQMVARLTDKTPRAVADDAVAYFKANITVLPEVHCG